MRIFTNSGMVLRMLIDTGNSTMRSFSKCNFRCFTEPFLDNNTRMYETHYRTNNNNNRSSFRPCYISFHNNVNVYLIHALIHEEVCKTKEKFAFSKILATFELFIQTAC